VHARSGTFAAVHGRTVLIDITMVLGLAGIFDVLTQPKAAFVASGHSKWRWLLIELVGTLLLMGAVVWLVYSVWVRRQVVAAGGRTRKKGAAFARMLGGGSGGAPRPAGRAGALTNAPSRSGSSSWPDPFAPKPMRPCSSCSNGKITCFSCGGRGHLPTGSGTHDPCMSCGASGHHRCNSCGGTGSVRA